MEEVPSVWKPLCEKVPSGWRPLREKVPSGWRPYTVRRRSYLFGSPSVRRKSIPGQESGNDLEIEGASQVWPSSFRVSQYGV